MSWRTLCALVLLGVLCLPEAGQAHRVNIFAWSQGAQIVGECAFNRGSGVRQGRIVVQDAVSGAQLLECRTDDQGRFRFPIPEAAVRAEHGIRITIMAGEGHQNHMEVPLEDLRGGAASVVESAARDIAVDAARQGRAEDARRARAGSGMLQQTATAAPAPEELAESAGGRGAAVESSPAVAAGEAGLTAAQIRQIVETALEQRLEPFYRYLAAREEAGPSLKDIVGGIGWILGLVGIAAYCRRRS